MRNRFIAAAILVTAILVVGCTQTVDEELLPTLVPQIDMQSIAQAVEAAKPTPRPTPTNTPVPTATAEDAADSDPGSDDAGSIVITYGDVVVAGAKAAAIETPVTEAVGSESDTDSTQPVLEPATETPAPTTGNPSDAPAESSVESSSAAVSISDAVADNLASETVTDTVQTDTTQTQTIGSEGVLTTTDTALVPGAETNASAVITATEEASETVTNTTEAESVDGAVVTDTVVANEAPLPPDAYTLPESMRAAIDNADMMRGEQLILSTGCTGCHSLDRGVVFVGPSWYDLATTAANRVEGLSAEVYMFRSILHPNEYVVNGFENTAMLPNYEETLSDQDIADLIGFMMTLRAR